MSENPSPELSGVNLKFATVRLPDGINLSNATAPRAVELRKDGPAYDLSDLITLAADTKASDIHLHGGSRPLLRVNGIFEFVEGPPLRVEDPLSIIKAVIPEARAAEVQEKGDLDFAFGRGGMRFRVNIAKVTSGGYNVAMRPLPGIIPSCEELGLPAAVIEFISEPNGLVLVTGPTGSGKSTTMAALIERINQTTIEGSHIVTLEDPPEYDFNEKRALFTQRQIGIDTPSFSEGLRRALRQDPDVVMVGEMRDLDTVRIAITAAETGHLVLGTLHTIGAAKTIDRLIGSFPAEERDLVRSQLSTSLRGVISQILLERADKRGRVPAFEVLVNTPAIANHIRENKIHSIKSDMQTGRKFGMQTLESHLIDLIDAGTIDRDTVLNALPRAEREEMAKSLDQKELAQGQES